jgi:hypothetical protein
MTLSDFKNKECHKKTSFFFVIILASCLLPTLISILILNIIDKSPEWAYFIQKGEFYLYSTSILAPGALVLFDFKTKSYDFFSILFWVSIAILLLSSLLYLLTLLLDVKVAQYVFNSTFLAYTSLIFLTFSIFVLYITNYMQNLFIDAKSESAKQINDIKNQLT